MTTWLVSRHAGTVEWAKRRGLALDRIATHLDAQTVRAGDRVFRSLPVDLAAEVCARGAEYWHLSLKLQPQQRGRELSADDLEGVGAELVRFEVRQVEGGTP